MKYFIFILLVIFTGTYAASQTYPVQVNAQVVAPFSPYLSDYTLPGAQKFLVNILLKDPTLPEYQAKLRLTIEGVGITIRTKSSYVPPPLVLPGGGIPLVLYGEDIADYFAPANLDFAGITRSQYERGAKLPEGVYRFTIEVLDYNRGTAVSNKGTSVAWIILNDPPLLNLPRKDAKLEIIDPTNIIFNWTPRHTASPNAAFTTTYLFKLIEIWPLNRNPYDAILTQPPLYETETNASQILYGPAEPALIPGRKYAWQLQARDEEGRDLFKNQGKSEVFVFQFGDALGLPENLRLQTANPSSLVVRWDQTVAGADAITYRVRYRPANKADGPWYEETTEEQWRTIGSLLPDTEYEMQVRAEQNVQLTEYSPSKIFKTKSAGANDFSCSSDIQPPPQPTTIQPLFKLGINDTIRAGGYDVVVRKVSGANGTYTGEGVAIVPWFMSAKVRVTFDKIGVNEQYWLTSGTIKSVWDANSKFLIKDEKKTDPSKAPDVGDQSVNIVQTETLIKIENGLIVSVTKNEDGEVVVETSSGETKVVPKGQSASVVDAAGNGYIVDKEGNIAKTTAETAMAAYEKSQRNYNMQLVFAPGTGKFGFDEKKLDALSSYYQQLQDGSFIPWKAVSSSKHDGVDAILRGMEIDSKKVRFEVSGEGVTPQQSTDSQFSLSLLGKVEGTEEELVAYFQPNDTAKQQVIGKLNLTSYDKITKNIVIVPVNMDLPVGLSAPIVKSALDGIFEQAVAYWQVSTANRVNVTFDQTFDDGESGLLSNYTADMKKVIAAYGQLQDETYYLFLIKDQTRSGASALGYMPRSKQAGFIFTTNHNDDATKIIRTMAHELGHGVFNLKHTFSEFPALSKGITKENLMDYPNGDKLYKYQWDYIHDPQKVIALFEDDEEGESYGPSAGIPDIWRNTDKTVHFVAPNKKIIRLPKETLSAYFSFGIGDFKDQPLLPSGMLTGFSILEGKDTVRYKASFSGNKFLGYTNKLNQYAKVLAKQNNTEADAAVIQLPYSAGFKIFRLKGVPYSYLTSGQVDESFIDLTDVASANLNAASWQELSSHDFSKGQVESGISSSSINPEYTDLLNDVDHNKFNQQYLLICKIMEFRTVYPDVYDRMTVSFNNWTDISVWSSTLFNDVLNLTPENAALVVLNKEKANITAGYFDYLCRKNEWYDTKNKEELLVLFLQEFQNLIKYNLKKYDDKIKILMETAVLPCDAGEVYVIVNKMSPEDIVNVVSVMSVDDLSLLCPKVRSRLIATVLDNFIVSEPYEKTIYKLLWTCPAGASRGLFLETLAETKNADQEYILGTLVSAVDDETLFMGENYNTMIMNFIIKAYGNVISSKSAFATKNIKPITELDISDVSALSEEQLVSLMNTIVTYNYQGFTKRLFKEVLKSICSICVMATSDDFQYDTKSVASFDEKTNQIGFSNKTVSGFITVSSSKEVKYHPLSPIILDDKAKLLDVYATSGGYYVPAIMLYFLEKKADAKTTVDAVQTTFDIASLAIPGGQATLALKLLNYADKVSAVSSLVGSYTETDYPNFAKVMNLTSGVLGVGNLTGGFVYAKLNKLDNIKSSMDLIDKSEDVISAAGHESKLTGLCDKIDLMNDPTKIDPDLAAVLNSTGKEKQTLIDILEMERKTADAAGKTNLANRLEGAVSKIRATAKGVKIVKSTRLQNLFEVMSKRFTFLANDGDKIYANAAKTKQLAHIQDGEIVMDRLDDIQDLGDNARLEESISDALYMEQKGGQLTEHSDDILIFDDNGTLKCLTGTNCFVANTLVATRTGSKVIQQIEIGDEVLSYNEKQKQSGWNKVTKLFSKTANKLNRLIVGKDTLFTTPEHKFMTAKGWVKAAVLSAGMMLQTQSGFAELASNQSIDSAATVYNFTVEQNHTYHVGHQQIVTHNKCEELGDILKQFDKKTQAAFVNDFKKNKALLDKFTSGEYSPVAWQLIHKMDPSLSKSEDWIKSLTNLAKKDPAILDDLKDPVLFNAWVDLRNNPDNAWKVYDTFKEAGKLSDNFKSYIKSKFFNEIMQKGKDFEDFVKNSLLNHADPIWKTLNLNPKDYRVFEQVQMKTGNLVDAKGNIYEKAADVPKGVDTRDEYFVADFVLVKTKKNVAGNATLDFQNSIILETKLSLSTDLTDRQLNAVSNIKSGNKSFTVRGNPFHGESESLLANDFLKVHSNGAGGVVSGARSLIKE
ncbi:polymorphic toxin-type HINT domain-containing protein [Pseudochryseolinea flava]|uniref:Fibronectin type-III domain-containing protein n=1 Tax=Pseudochryseolinea flava TaxID=2059302 RepID=A0A364Y791_9BACT|nr:polymorphic toxin-type HINT domain-containing protein [Pseudochryseolinea flava]RAW02131.1 hypothetical protein DQQ10_06170 [Pseudochryseolinea flava]